MRILNQDTDSSINEIILYLTAQEAKDLMSALKDVMESSKAANHVHVSSEDFNKEITVCVYDPDQLSDFDKRSQRLITEDR